MTTHRWILARTGRWHAWPHGARRSICGTLTADNLRVTPAVRIQSTLPPPTDDPLCGTCRSKLGIPVGRDATTPTDSRVIAWLEVVGKHLARIQGRHGGRSLTIDRRTKRVLAERLALIGAPDNPEAIAVYDQIRLLLLSPKMHRRRNGHTILKLAYIKEALTKLPPRVDAIQHVAESVKLWRRITGRDLSANERFRPDTVIETTLAIPMPEPYIRHLHTKGISALAAIFHPNTLERFKKDPALRGIFGGDFGGSSEYWARTAEQLASQVIED